MGENFAFLLPVVLTLFGLVFLVVGRFGNRAALFWGAGYLCATFGFLVPLAETVLPIPLVALSADAAFLSAFFLYSHALATHFEAPRRVALRAGVAAVAYACAGAAVLLGQSLRVELFVNDIACGLLLTIAVVSVRRRAGSWMDRALLCAVMFVVLEVSVRTVVFFVMTRGVAMGEFIGSTYAYVMQITATIGALVMALAALASVALRIVERHRKAAEEDPLTGLLNRRGFEQLVSRNGSARGGEAAIIVGDIDWFKSINDRFGHAAGDAAIREVAAVLGALSWPELAVARFGGEEFIAYLPNCRLQDAHTLANTVRIAISERDLGGIGIDRSITASFGVAVTAAGDHTIHDAISRADRLLYLAKSSGRNRVVSSPADIPAQSGPKFFVV